MAGFSWRPSSLVHLLFHWPGSSTLVSFSGKTSTCGSPSLSGAFWFACLINSENLFALAEFMTFLCVSAHDSPMSSERIVCPTPFQPLHVISERQCHKTIVATKFTFIFYLINNHLTWISSQFFYCLANFLTFWYEGNDLSSLRDWEMVFMEGLVVAIQKVSSKQV